MIACTTCQRHHRADGPCPFCGTPPVKRAARFVFAALTPVFLAACYGGAPIECDTNCDTPDADDDGYREGDDCDDADPAVNPGATEVCDDGLDNDCDQIVDTDDSDCAG